MAAVPKYDLCVKVGSYEDGRTGEVKGRYKKIGVQMSGNDGDFLLLDRSVNLAAFPVRNAGDDMILISRFPVRNNQQGNSAPVDSMYYDYQAYFPQQPAPVHHPAPAPQQSAPVHHPAPVRHPAPAPQQSAPVRHPAPAPQRPGY